MMFVGSFKGSETCSKNLVKWEYPVRKRGFVVQIMIEELTAYVCDAACISTFKHSAFFSSLSGLYFSNRDNSINATIC
jgi:hypothetical protein